MVSPLRGWDRFQHPAPGRAPEGQRGSPQDLGAEARPAPGVTPTQWGLALVSLLAAAGGYLTTSLEDLAVLTYALTAINLLLLALVANEALRTRALGKVLLLASMQIFFWIGALQSARQEPRFLVPAGFPFLLGQYSPKLLQEALFYMALFQLMLLAGYAFRPGIPWLVSRLTSRVDSRGRGRWLLLYPIAACSWIPLLFAFNFEINPAIDSLLAARAGFNSTSQDIGLIVHVYWFGMFGAAFLLVEALVVRAWDRVWAFLPGAIAALPFVLRGTRHHWLFVGIPLCVAAFSGLGGKKGRPRMVGMALVVFLLLLVAQLQFFLRNVGWTEIQQVRAEELTRTDTTEQFTALIFALCLVPDIHDYFMESTTPYFLIHWIPRQFWPGKPTMRSWAYYNDTFTYGRPLNVTPSIIGQFHINWGIFGVVFIGLWLGFLTGLADRLMLAIRLEHQLAVATTIGMLYAFVISSFRFYSPIYLTYFVYGLLGMLLVTRVEPSLRNRPV